MDRSYQEIVNAALEVRAGLRAKGHDPLLGKFFVTEREKLLVLDHPPFMVPVLNLERDRICGLKLEVITDEPMNHTQRRGCP